MSVELEARLREAEHAYHLLMTGRSVAELRDQNGELVRYTPASAARLLAYIQQLRQQLGLIPKGHLGPGRAFF